MAASDLSISSGAVTIDVTGDPADMYILVTDENVTGWTVSNMVSGDGFLLVVTRTAGDTVSWSGLVDVWTNGEPVLGEGEQIAIPIAQAGSTVLGSTPPSTPSGPTPRTMEAGATISAGRFVNVYNDGGTPKLRHADNSLERPAHGYVINGATTGNTATYYTEGAHPGVSGLTPGATYWLSTAGQLIGTQSTTDGYINQSLGVAHGAATLLFAPGVPWEVPA